MKYSIAISCAVASLGLFNVVDAHPGHDHDHESPLFYDTSDSTDVLAIPSDSSAWEQEEEIQELQDEEKAIQQKKAK